MKENWNRVRYLNLKIIKIILKLYQIKHLM